METREIWPTRAIEVTSADNTSKQLPIQLAPFLDESLYSYMLRVHRANFVPMNYLINSTFANLESVDTALNAKYHDAIMEKQSITQEQVHKLDMMQWLDYFPSRQVKAKRIFSGNLKVCPVCLDKDKTPYFRLKWRLNAVNLCDVHKCLLINRCPKCNAPIRPHKLRIEDPIYRCWNCKDDLRNKGLVFLNTRETDNILDFGIETILAGRKSKLLDDLSIPAPELFDVVYKMITFLIKAYDITDDIFQGYFLDLAYKLKPFWYQLSSKFQFFKEPAISFVLFNAAFALLANPDKLLEYVESKQSIFNRITNDDCPPFLDGFRNVRPKVSIDENKILEIIARLKANGKEITNRTVAYEGNFDYCLFNYSPNRKLGDLIKKENATVKKELVQEQESKIKECISSLVNRGKKITLLKVSRITEIPAHVIESTPELNQFFANRREMDPTYIDRVKKAIVALQRSKKRITTKSISVKANISLSVLRRYPILLETINAAKVAIHPKFKEIKAKIESLRASNAIITRAVIEKETGVGIQSFYDYPDLRQLIEGILGDTTEKQKKRLANAADSLEQQGNLVTITNLLAEAKIDSKTVQRNDLRAFIKELVYNSTERRILKAKQILLDDHQEVTSRSLLQQAGLGKSGWKRDDNLQRYLEHNPEINKIIQRLLAQPNITFLEATSSENKGVINPEPIDIPVDNLCAEKKHKCPYCEYSTNKKDHLTKHLASKHNVGVELSPCPYCDHKAKSPYLLKIHLADRHDIKVQWFPCPKCNYRAKQKSTLTRHLAAKHDIGVEIFKCPHCDYEAKQGSNLKRHLAAKHDVGVIWYKCSQENCDYKAKQKIHLTRHLAAVHGINAIFYQCPHCEYQGKQKINLLEHLARKHGINPKYFKCPRCKYVAKSKQRLKDHLASVHDEGGTWYQCPHCSHKTRLKENLAKHIYCKHNRDAYIFKCPHCPFKTKRKDSLRQHLNSKHKNVDVTSKTDLFDFV